MVNFSLHTGHIKDWMQPFGRDMSVTECYKKNITKLCICNQCLKSSDRSTSAAGSKRKRNVTIPVFVLYTSRASKHKRLSQGFDTRLITK